MSQYSDLVLSRSPLLLVPLANVTTGLVDLTGNAHNVTVAGAVTTAEAIVPNDDDPATTEGSLAVAAGGATTLAGGAWTSGPQRTYEVWFVLNSTAGEHGLLYAGPGGAILNLYQFGNVFNVYAGGQPGSALTTALVAGTVYHLAVVLDGTAGTVTAYLNGASIGSQSGFVPATPEAGIIRLGAYDTTAAPLGGRMADFAVYPTALTAGQVAANYAQGNAAPGGADTIGPVLNVEYDELQDGNGAYPDNVYLTLRATDAGSGVTSASYVLDGAAPVAYVDLDTIQNDAWTPGAHVISLTATDGASNTSGPTAFNFTIQEPPPPVPDVTPPNISLEFSTGPVEGGVNYYPAGTVVTVYAADAVDFTNINASYVLDGGAPVPYADGDTIPGLGQGDHTVTLTATDQSGNVAGPTTYTFHFLPGPVPSGVLPTPVAGDVWGQALNFAIQTMHLGPGVHTQLPAPGMAVPGALFVCTTHNVVHKNSGTEWLDYFNLPV